MAQDVQGLMIRLEATTAQLRAEMKRADAAVAGATKGIDKELSKVDRAFDRLGLGAGKLSAAARSLAPALAGLVTIEALRRAQQLGEEFTLLESRIKRLSGGTAEAAVTYSRLAEVARNSGASLGDTVKLWESLTGSLKELGATDSQVVRLTDTLQKIGTIGGSSAEEVSGALRQLGQGLAGGVLRAEEFNSVLEGMPELAREIARGLGVPFGELRQMMLDGELTAERVLGAIQSRVFDVDAEFAKLPRTVSQASTALTNDFGRAIADIDNAIGGSKNLAWFLDTLAKGIRFTAGDLTDLERLNELTAQRASLEQSFEMAQRRTLLSAKERGVYEAGLKRLNDEILEIQNRRVQQLKEEGQQIQSNGPAINEQYDKYLAKLKESAALQGVNTEVGKVRYAIETGELGKLTEAQQQALLVYAREKDAKIAAAKAGVDHAKALADQTKAVEALLAKYDPAGKAQADYQNAVALADKALRDNTYTTEQYQAVVQGLFAELNKPTWDKYNKEAEETAKTLKQLEDETQAIIDRLDPAGKAARDYAAEQKRLNEALVEFPRRADEIRAALGKLGEEYEANQRELTAWGRLTDAAVERVDEAFADAWKNIDQGFDGFADGLKDGFKQLLAELAHEAITKPIVISFANQLLGTSKPGGISDVWGSMFGGGTPAAGGTSGGLGGALQAANQARSLYSMYGTAQTLLPILQGGYASGGFGGALGALGSYAGSFLGGSGAAASMAAGSTAAGYGGAGYASWVAAQGAGGAAAGAGGIGAGINGALSSAASMWWLAPIIGAWQSGKLYDAGVRPDAGETWKSTQGNKLGQIGNVLPAAQSKFFEVLDSGLQKGSFGLVNGKVAAMLSGSTFHQALWGGINKALFGGSWQTKDGGLALGADGGELDAAQYIYQKKKGGLFSSSKKRTRYSDLDAETLAALQGTFDDTEATVAAIYKALGLAVDEGSLAGLQLAREQISTKGKTEEEISAALNEWFGKTAEAMNTELARVFDTGLGYDLAGMQAFVANMQGVNALFDQLNLSLYDSTVAGGKMAEQLSAVAGGFDVLAANTATYYEGFYSAEEKTANTLEAITKAFADADVELAGSREDYRAMVESIDRTTEAGREMFATMMALSDEAAAYVAILDQQAAAAAQALGVAVDGAYASLQRSIAAQQKDLQADYNARAAALNATAAAATANVSALTGISNSLSAALTRLRGTSSDAVRMLRAQALATLQGALATAQGGGSLAGLDGLQDALDVSASMDASLYASLEDFEREQGRTANLIAELEHLNGKQLSAEQQLLDTTKAQLEQAKQQFEQQMEGLNVQLAFAQLQLDALNGVDNSVKSVAEAIHAMNLAVGAALAAMGGDTGKNATPANVATLADSVYRGVLGREADAAGLAYWQGQVTSGALTLDQLPDAIHNAAVANGEIPAFATGGMHLGGARIVGEFGPELEVTGPARIYNANQTASMLNGGGSDAAAEEVRALRGEVRFLSQALSAIQYATEETRKALRVQNEIGVPQWSG